MASIDTTAAVRQAVTSADRDSALDCLAQVRAEAAARKDG
jgi:hypothetical protein